MTAILKTIHKLQINFDREAQRFAFRHPFLAFMAMFIGMPLFVLVAVLACAALVILPFLFIM